MDEAYATASCHSLVPEEHTRLPAMRFSWYIYHISEMVHVALYQWTLITRECLRYNFSEKSKAMGNRTRHHPSGSDRCKLNLASHRQRNTEFPFQFPRNYSLLHFQKQGLRVSYTPTTNSDGLAIYERIPPIIAAFAHSLTTGQLCRGHLAINMSGIRLAFDPSNNGTHLCPFTIVTTDVVSPSTIPVKCLSFQTSFGGQLRDDIHAHPDAPAQADLLMFVHVESSSPLLPQITCHSFCFLSVPGSPTSVDGL